MNRAGQLARGNLAYRDPALYDDMLAGDDTAGAVARAAATAIGIAEQRSVLDLGCGTGRVASQLRATYGWRATGVDVQPGLIAYARDRDPAVRWYTGDITTVRLGETYDVVTSLGNTLAYLHTNQALHAALRTARAHTAVAGLLLITTITTRPPPPPEDQRGPREINTCRGRATVEVSSTFDLVRRLLVTTRTWRFPGGQFAHDCYARRVWTLEQRHAHASHAGFQPLEDTIPDITLAAIRT